MRQRLPPSVQRLFWDVDKEKVDIVADRKSIVERVLNYGALSDWRWLVTTYGAGGIEKVLSARGALPRTNVRERARRLFSLLTKIEE